LIVALFTPQLEHNFDAYFVVVNCVAGKVFLQRPRARHLSVNEVRVRIVQRAQQL
jgi:hypothetical protein